MAMSSSAICEGPSSPMEIPQWDPATLIFVWEITPILKLSNALVKKQAKVEINATQRSRQAIPIPTPAKFCSQIKHSTCLNGKKYQSIKLSNMTPD